MNFKVFDTIYDTLKHSIEQELAFMGAKVFMKPVGDKYPLIVVKQIENSNIGKYKDYESKQSLLGIEINIYTTPKSINDVLMDEIEVSRKIQEVISSVMEYTFQATRISCQPTPNLDELLYRVTMRYNCKISDYRNKIY